MWSLKQTGLDLIPSYVTLVDNQTSLNLDHCLFSNRDSHVLKSCCGHQVKDKCSVSSKVLPSLAFCHQIHTYPFFFLQHTAHSLCCQALCCSCPTEEYVTTWKCHVLFAVGLVGILSILFQPGNIFLILHISMEMLASLKSFLYFSPTLSLYHSWVRDSLRASLMPFVASL